VFQLNGTTISTLLGPPYTTSFTIPGTANAGDTVTLTVVVSDLAGNANSSSRGIQVVAAGVVVGQVLSDVNGLPFEGATVQVVGGDDDDTSDDNGRYSIPVDNSHLFLSVSTVANLSTGVPATVPVEREVSVQTGVGTVPIDARLTPVGPGIPIGPAGGTLTSGALTISMPAGAISATTSLHLTTLSQQGLPGLLPLGWSPITAFDLRADSSTSAAANANFSQLPNVVALHLVAYDYSAHAWKMVTPNLSAVNGALTIPLASLGNYALVSTDIGNTSVVIPSAGQPLAGVTMVALPASTTASGSLNPASVAPTGGTSAATLAVLSPTPLPSGTVIQANVTESYSLTSGKQLSGQRRTEDILVYQVGAPSGATVAATFPVTPSETFQIGEVSAGNVHLDLLSGRESVRGQVGGNDAATVQGGNATLTVAAGSLPKNTAVSVSPEGLDNFLPTTTNLTPLAEYNVDLSGQTLTTAAQLSVSAGTGQAGDNIFLVQVQRIAGAPYLVVVSQAQVNGSNLVTLAAPGLPGITQGGDFVFYKLSSPTGFVSGTVTTSSGPVAALVQTDGLPFVTFANFAGSYVIPALTGPVNLTASVPNTALAGTGSAQVIAGQTASANLTLVGQIESATVTPPNGAVGVPLTAEVDIAAVDAFNQATITTANVTLTQTGQGSNVPVPVRFVFSQGGTKLAVFPLTALQPSTTYTVAASGLANGVGGLIAVPTVSFTTQAITPPNFNTDALGFAMPDQNGNVAISAPADSFPPGTTILIVDQTNGIVLSLTVANDGSVSGQMPATIDDVLAVTITAPDKTTASFTRSKFVAPDGTTAIGSGGGTVSGPGGVELRIPNGALDKGVTFKIESFGAELFPERPSLPNANFGSGLKISSPEMPKFKKEVKLAFPKPTDAPDGSFYYIYRRLSGPNNTYTFETIDHGFVEGTGASAKVVTGAPLSGLNDSISAFSFDSVGGFVFQSLASQYEFLMWTYDRLLPGVSSSGIITGKALRTVPPSPGQIDPTYVTIPPDSNESGASVTVWRSDDTEMKTIARTDSTGRFSLFDPTLGGGTRNIKAQVGSETVDAVAAEVITAQPDDQFYGVDPALYQQYRNVGRVNPIFSALTPQPQAPALDVRIFVLDNNGNRVDTAGLVVLNQQIVIGVNSNTPPGSALTYDLRSVRVGTQQELSFAPDSKNSAPHMDFVVTSYSPPQTGAFTITATALPVFGGAPITASRSFRVIAAGGAVTTATPGQPPQIISLIPANHTQGVGTNAVIELVFSEPVKNVPGNITLTGADGPVMLKISGVGIPSTAGVTPVYDSLVDSSLAVTSLTLQPIQGLKFQTTYSLTLTQAIVDLNNLPLIEVPRDFTTGGPSFLGSVDTSSFSPRLVVLGDSGFLATYNGLNGLLQAYDVAVPSKPQGPVTQGSGGKGVGFGGRPIDLAGEQGSTVNAGGSIVAVATGAGQPPLPSNLFLYDVTDPTNMQQIGAVSFTPSAFQAGTILRVVVKHGIAYASVFPIGLEFASLTDVAAKYASASATFPTLDAMQFALGTNGFGFALDLIKPISVSHAANGAATPVALYDLKVGDYSVPDSNGILHSKTLVLATGQYGLLAVADPDPNGPRLLSENQLADPSGSGAHLDQGSALDLGLVQGKNLAVVVGAGAASDPKTGALVSGPVLAVIDLTDVRNPRPIGFMPLPGTATDVVLNGSSALVGSGNLSFLVNLNDPAQPVMAGVFSGISGRLATNDLGLMFSTGLTSNQGGVHIGKIKPVCPALGGASAQPSSGISSASNWAFQYGFTGQDGSQREGLVLQNVKLGNRGMADSLSLPYVSLLTESHSALLRCELRTDGALPCPAEPSATIKLISFLAPEVSGNPVPKQPAVNLQAQFLIDKIDGDPADTSNGSQNPESCVLITQRHEFFKEGTDDPCEASGKFPCARFKPTVSYRYYSDTNRLLSLKGAQRLKFNVIEPPPNPQPQPPNAVILPTDCEGIILGICLNFFSSVNNSPIGVLKVYDDQNPLLQEAGLTVISNGKPVGIQQSSGATRPIDNMHQSSSRTVLEPFPRAGCPDCVHMHWRWSKSLTPGSLGVDSKFDNNKGLPFIPVGSNQDVTVYDIAEQDEHPDDVGTLVGTNPVGMGPDSSNQPVFWYVGSGHHSSDSFLTHGGFFSAEGNLPFVTNLSASPSSDGTFAINFNLALPYSKQFQGVFLGSDRVQWQITMTDANQGALSKTTGTESSALTGLGEATILVNGINFSPSRANEVVQLTVLATDLDTGRQYQQQLTFQVP
jgi:hypothetical protein